MANTTARLYIRCATWYSLSLKKRIDLQRSQTYYLVWFEGARKCVRSLGHFYDAAQVALINMQSELRNAAINPQAQGNRREAATIITRYEWLKKIGAARWNSPPKLRDLAFSLHKIPHPGMFMGGRIFLRAASVLHAPGPFGGKRSVFIQKRPV